MRHIVQKEPCGCGLACVASITGKTYDEIARISNFLLERDCWTQGTTTHELHMLLNIFHFHTPGRLIPLRQKKLIELPTNALLKVGDWHWCVWDARRKRLIDPLPHPDPWIKPSAYLPVRSK